LTNDLGPNGLGSNTGDSGQEESVDTFDSFRTECNLGGRGNALIGTGKFLTLAVCGTLLVEADGESTADKGGSNHYTHRRWWRATIRNTFGEFISSCSWGLHFQICVPFCR
jgi:hypothetical protein